MCADMKELDLAIVLCSQGSLEQLQQEVCQVDDSANPLDEPSDEDFAPGSPPKASSRVRQSSLPKPSYVCCTLNVMPDLSVSEMEYSCVQACHMPHVSK